VNILKSEKIGMFQECRNIEIRLVELSTVRQVIDLSAIAVQEFAEIGEAGTSPAEL
jgi:hypothetical protein